MAKKKEAEKQPEQAAEQAASIIFELRNARLELITGEYGDGVYGAGLESASSSRLVRTRWALSTSRYSG